MIEIQIDEAYQALLSQGIMHETASTALNHTGHKDAELSIVVTGDAQLQALNLQFLDTDAPTDVLSFPAGEADPEYLGDIAISYPQAASQAEAAGHPVIQELQLLAVHGILHLLGYDHDSEENKSKMWAAQDEILDLLDVGARPNE